MRNFLENYEAPSNWDKKQCDCCMKVRWIKWSGYELYFCRDCWKNFQISTEGSVGAFFGLHQPQMFTKKQH